MAIVDTKWTKVAGSNVTCTDPFVTARRDDDEVMVNIYSRDGMATYVAFSVDQWQEIVNAVGIGVTPCTDDEIAALDELTGDASR